MRHFFLAFSLAAALSGLLPAQAAEPNWHLEKTVPLGPPDDWDFVYLGPAAERVYVAHGDRISIVGIRAGRVVGTLTPIAGAHDVALVPSVGRLYVGNGRTGIVSIFDGNTLKHLGDIPAKPDTDAIAYDPADGVVIVADGDSGYATLIDPATDKVSATIAIGPGAEGIATDGDGHAFINISDGGEMVRVDLKRHAVDRRWTLKGCESPHGLAMDHKAGRLFVSCRNRRMFVVDSVSGAIVTRLPIGRGTDSAAFDPLRKLAFSSNKDGTISVIAERGRDRYSVLQPIKTAPGAATMAEDPKSGRIFVVAAKVLKRLPPHHSGEVPEYRYQPGTARLLIFAPGR